jgi:hypothetical protein
MIEERNFERVANRGGGGGVRVCRVKKKKIVPDYCTFHFQRICLAVLGTFVQQSNNLIIFF